MPASAADRTRGHTAPSSPDPSSPDPAAGLADLCAALEREYLPQLSVNGVVFGADAGTLRVLLMRWLDADAWGLPGGYVRRDEDVDDAAARMVREVTGLEGVYLRQFHTFGRADRAVATFGGARRAPSLPADHWIFGRVVSVGYVALVDAARADDLPLGATLLPGAFTIPELQRLYETVLGRAFDRRNFLNRMLDLGLIERLPGQRVSRTSRPLNLYRWVGRDVGLGGRTATG